MPWSRGESTLDSLVNQAKHVFDWIDQSIILSTWQIAKIINQDTLGEFIVTQTMGPLFWHESKFWLSKGQGTVNAKIKSF